MTTNTARRTFVLPTASVYTPGAPSEEAHEAAPKSSGGGCCGSAPVESTDESSGCGPGHDPDTTDQPTSGCC